MQTERFDAPPPPLSQVGDHRGEKHNRLVVLGYAGRDRWGTSMWHCRCDCGGMTAVRIAHLRAGVVKSCGCERGHPLRIKFAGAALPGGDRVVRVEGDRAVIACDQGHTWEAGRRAMLARRLEARAGQGKRSQCPTCRVRGTVDMRGQTVGLLTVLERAGTDAPVDGRFHSQATWRVRCACGAEKVVRGAHLRRDQGAVRTCGARGCKARWRSLRVGAA